MLALRLAIPTLALKLTARPQLVVGLFAALLFFPLLGSARTFTYHESHIVQGAREMLATGDWLIPRIGGAPWLEKPPLPQWLVAISGAVFGQVNEFTARLPAALIGLFGILAVTRLIERYRDVNLAMLSGVFLATMTTIVTYARLAEPDIFLWAIVTLAICVFARKCVVAGSEPPHCMAREGEVNVNRSSHAALAFFILLGLTQTAKGLVFGAVMVLAPCLAWFALHRFRNAKWCLSPFSWLVGIAIAAAWPVAVLLKYPDVLELWKYHTLGRLDANVAYNPKPFWYYFTTLPWQAAPAILIALPALPRSLKAAWNQSQSFDRFLWLWFAMPMLALSAASGKHHHYLIYALPPFAIWAADGAKDWARLVAWLWSFRGYRFGSSCAFLAALGAGSVIVEKQGIVAAWEALAVGGFVIVGLILMAECCLRQKRLSAGIVFSLMLAGVLLYVNTIWLTRTDLYKPDGELAARIERATSPEDVIIFYNIEPARMLLDMQRRVVWLKDDPELLRKAIAEKPGSVIVSALYFESEMQGVVHIVEFDRTPHAKWPGRPISHLIAYRGTP